MYDTPEKGFKDIIGKLVRAASMIAYVLENSCLTVKRLDESGNVNWFICVRGRVPLRHPAG